MAVTLNARGVFTWSEWADALAAQIKAAQTHGDADLGDTYYQHWLAALEALVQAKGVTTQTDLTRYQQAWDTAADRTPHGQAIALSRNDFQ